MTLAARFVGTRGGFRLDVTLAAEAGRVTALFGHSGSGKTSVLRAIAGLERFAGACRLDGEVWQDESLYRPAHQRAVGYVFQEPSLFPHLNVRQNLGFGLRRSSDAALIDFDGAVALLGLGPMLGRAPHTLSGGERQRVALGRALLSQPKLLLLDEPMSALDRGAKDEILPYFEALNRTLSIPMLLVTHDIAEVERLADTVVLLEAGRVVATGPLNDMLISEALGLRRGREAAAVLAGRVVGYDAVDGLSDVDAGGHRLSVAGHAGAVGAAVRVRVAARDVSLSVTRPSVTTILNVVPVTIVAIEPVSEAEVLATLRLGGATLLARLTRRSQRQLGLAAGQEVFAQVKSVSLLTGPGR
jgi:molybdate transport system ATP-binding protein